MTPPKWEYGRKTAEGVPIWYVTIDESGHPYYEDGGSRPFTMGAILTGDPKSAVNALSSAADKRKSVKYATATGEMKHTHSSETLDKQVMDQLGKQGYVLFATSMEMKDPIEHSPEYATAIYLGTLSRLLNKIADYGPEGIYRIRIDESEYLDESLLRLCAESAFSDPCKSSLARHSSARMYDSAFDPAIQLADSFIGQYRNALSENKGGEFADRHKIFVANRKKSDQGRAVSSLFKTGWQDSGAMGIRVGDTTSLLSPYSDETKVCYPYRCAVYKKIRPRTKRGTKKSGFFHRSRNTKTTAKKTTKTARSRRK